MRLPADQRRQQLLDVARDVFAERGFHATSMDEIAEAAGVTKPVLYQHFPSKRSLYIELLTDTGRAAAARARRPRPRNVERGRDRVESGFLAYFRFVADSRAGFRLLFSASIRTDPEFARVVDTVVQAAADVISELIEIPASDAHRRVLANALVGMAESVGRHTSDDPETAFGADAEDLARWISELAWFGLRGVRAEEPVTAFVVAPGARGGRRAFSSTRCARPRVGSMFSRRFTAFTSCQIVPAERARVLLGVLREEVEERLAGRAARFRAATRAGRGTTSRCRSTSAST